MSLVRARIPAASATSTASTASVAHDPAAAAVTVASHAGTAVSGIAGGDRMPGRMRLRGMLGAASGGVAAAASAPWEAAAAATWGAAAASGPWSSRSAAACTAGPPNEMGMVGAGSLPRMNISPQRKGKRQGTGKSVDAWAAFRGNAPTLASRQCTTPRHDCPAVAARTPSSQQARTAPRAPAFWGAWEGSGAMAWAMSCRQVTTSPAAVVVSLRIWPIPSFPLSPFSLPIVQHHGGE